VLPGCTTLRSCAARTPMRDSFHRRVQGSGCARSGSCADRRGCSRSIGAVPCAAQIPDMKAALAPCSRATAYGLSEKVYPGGCDGQVCRARCNRFGRSGYEPLTPVVDPEKAIEKGSTVLYDGHKDNVAYRWELEVVI